MRSGFVHDKSGSAPITIFRDNCITAKKKTLVFQLTDSSLSKYKTDCVLKSLK